ncbi:MAG: response regulator [Gammaproteobacteria bacterium]|nr:response regulator [Gammaproteobacteria bacterium]
MTTPKYMILDNDDNNSKVMTAMLEFFGECICQVFTSPSQLLDALKQDKPNKIFCNVTARGCDCRELFENTEINLPFIFISSLNKSEERRHSYLDSGHPYITYPLTIKEIQKHLKPESNS